MKTILNLSALIILFLSFAPLQTYAETPQYYTCPMHPHYISEHEGSCPICGMDLILMQSESPMQDMAHNHAQNDEPDHGGHAIRPAVSIAPALTQKIGVKTEKAQLRPIGQITRSYGSIHVNERLQLDVSSRVEGWVEDLAVNAVGDDIKKGEQLFHLYSPALISAQQDFLSALHAAMKPRIKAARKRLISLGMQEQVIQAIEKTGIALERIPYYAEANGILSTINIREGSFVKPGTNLMRLQNYKTVWVEAHVALKDMPFISEQSAAEISVPPLNIYERAAQIDYIHPTIDMKERTGRIRLILDNEAGQLRPGTYVDIRFESDVTARLSVPDNAILSDKDGDYILRVIDHNSFQPQRVTTGLSQNGYTEIRSGLAENDEIVTSGQFLIDSESRLKDALRQYTAGGTHAH